jgi:hypothetical protein
MTRLWLRVVQDGEQIVGRLALGPPLAPPYSIERIQILAPQMTDLAILSCEKGVCLSSAELQSEITGSPSKSEPVTTLQ